MLSIIFPLFLLFNFSNAVNVYLSPSYSHFKSALSPTEASAQLARHLGLDLFEPNAEPDAAQQSLFGTGPSSAVLITINEEDAKVVLPKSLQRSFTLSLPPNTPIHSLSSVASTSLHRASDVYETIFDVRGSSWDSLAIRSLTALLHSTTNAFAALELDVFQTIREDEGVDSESYRKLAKETKALLQGIVNRRNTEVHLAVLVFADPNSLHHKREPSPQESQTPFPPNAPPQQPIGSVSTCFATADICTNSTDTCSGRGQCVEATKSGRTCFICTCNATKTGSGNQVKTEHWVGQSCERKDVSGPFVLLTGTVLVLFLLIVGSISLLYGVGYQDLPNTLMGTATNGRKD